MSGDRKQPRPGQRAASRSASGATSGKAGAKAGGRKAGKGKWSRGWRRGVKWVAITLGTLFVLGLGAFAFAYATVDVPDPNEGFEAQTTYVYYADGKTVLGKFAEQDRTSVELSEIPDSVQDAVIAAEDRTFRTNQGLDPQGIVRAAFNNASGGDTQGASTITQQYVKVLYLTQDRTWSRKAKEAILSLKIHRQMSKDEILEGYLNTIYFGRGAYGVEAASRAYFQKPSSQLGLREAAVLAAVINSPNGYDPADGKQARQGLKERYDYVIDGMEEMGTIPASLVGKRVLDRLPKFPEVQQESQYGAQRGHVLKMVRNELTELGYSDSEIDTGGLRITTTFTRQAMKAAQEGTLSVRPDLKGLHAAVATVDVDTGGVRGIYAGQDYLASQLNWAVEGGAPGSTFKPFALAAGLGYGVSLQSVVDGSSPQDVGGTDFSNQGEGGGVSYGPITMLQATIDSVNTAYVRMVYEMDGGVGRVIDTAVDMGIPRNAPGLDDSLSIVLGSATISPVDMANAYGTIANGGVAKDAYVIEAVDAPQGEDYKHQVTTRQAISEEVAADTSYALQQVTAQGTGTNANVIGRPVAGKTGTATDDNGNVRSSWFVGYTPQLSTAVMYSRGNGNEPLDGFLPTFYGGEYPARTWAAVMSGSLEGQEILPFPPPAYLDATVDEFVPPPPPEPSPTETESEDAEEDEGGDQGDENEGGDEAEDTDEPSPSDEPSSEEPSPSETATPTPTETPTGGGGGGGGGGGNGGGGNGRAGEASTPPAARSGSPSSSGRRARAGGPGRRAA